MKPPQNPVARKRVLLWDSTLPLAERPKKSPIKRQPIILTKKVPKKKLWKRGLRGLEIKKRKTLPIPPPKKQERPVSCLKGTN